MGPVCPELAFVPLRTHLGGCGTGAADCRVSDESVDRQPPVRIMVE
jgi:hypothetical protein